jgi:2-polyprenyl-3-methyl-5-hydroxy-6-metoxy-1,4-benzoquinol methylase
MKILVGIANHGTKNMGYLQALLKEYRGMSFDVHFVILSDQPKDLGPDVEVRVGAPTSNPWSLPFAHQQVFADRIDEFDLFIYSEDDTLLTERNIQAFLRANEQLPASEVPGFLRYEIEPSGAKYCCSIHSHYHWEVGSFKRVGEHAFAYLTNEHSALYLLTRAQLQHCIDSGGYLVPPHEGRYDLLCSAATDPYVNCGLRKLIPVSHIDDFLIQHLPNVYLGKMGIDMEEFAREVAALEATTAAGASPAQLFPTATALECPFYDKFYYDLRRDDALALVGTEVNSVLSVACGWGATEEALVEQGKHVVGIPLDSGIGAVAEAKGVTVTAPDMEAALQTLDGQVFDVLLVLDVLQHLPAPEETLVRLLALLAPGGSLIASVPNFGHVSMRKQRLLGKPEHLELRKIGDFAASRLHYTTPGRLRGLLRDSGLKVEDQVHTFQDRYQPPARMTLGLFNGLLASSTTVRAVRR